MLYDMNMISEWVILCMDHIVHCKLNKSEAIEQLKKIHQLQIEREEVRCGY